MDDHADAYKILNLDRAFYAKLDLLLKVVGERLHKYVDGDGYIIASMHDQVIKEVAYDVMTLETPVNVYIEERHRGKNICVILGGEEKEKRVRPSRAARASQTPTVEDQAPEDQAPRTGRGRRPLNLNEEDRLRGWREIAEALGSTEGSVRVRMSTKMLKGAEFIDRDVNGVFVLKSNLAALQAANEKRSKD